jgi:hypothetical protein
MPLLGFEVQQQSELPVFIESDDVKYGFRATANKYYYAMDLNGVRKQTQLEKLQK